MLFPLVLGSIRVHSPLVHLRWVVHALLQAVARTLGVVGVFAFCVAEHRSVYSALLCFTLLYFHYIRVFCTPCAVARTLGAVRPFALCVAETP
jgi:hypothetical protein